MNIYLMGIAAILLMLVMVGAYWIAIDRGWIDDGPGHNPFEGMPERVMDAMEADSGHNPRLRRPNEAFWRAHLEQHHPYLEAALDFDEQLPAEDRKRYDSFWTALRDQDDAFWSSLGAGDDRAWAHLERKHGVQLPIPVPSGGGS